MSSTLARSARGIEMNSINTAVLSLFLLGSSFVAVDVQAANMLINGSFESPVILPPNVIRTHQVPTQSIDGWRLTGKVGTTLAEVDTIKCPEAATASIFGVNPVNYCPAAEGQQYINLGMPSRGATISQPVRTTKDTLYFLRLSVAATTQPSITGPVPGIHVEVIDDNGTHLVDTMVGGIHVGGNHALVWKAESVTFRGTTAGATIMISDEHVGENYESFVDNVVLEASRFELARLWMGFLMTGVLGLLLWYSIHRIGRRRT